MAPTYSRRRPGSPSNGRLGSARPYLSVWRNSPVTTPDANPKRILRQEALARRSGLTGESRVALSERLTREGLRLASLWKPDVVSAFHPIQDEPDTLPLLAALSGAGFATALPVVIGRGRPLIFRLWRPGDPTSAGALGIAEPQPRRPEVEPDLLFVPLACFDMRGHRIGFGAGHYDRTLERLRAIKPIHAVGVAYGVCEVAAVPYEAHDQPLDVVLTEQDTFSFGGS